MYKDDHSTNSFSHDNKQNAKNTAMRNRWSLEGSMHDNPRQREPFPPGQISGGFARPDAL